MRQLSIVIWNIIIICDVGKYIDVLRLNDSINCLKHVKLYIPVHRWSGQFSYWNGWVDDLKNRLLLQLLVKIDALGIEIMCLKDSLKDRLLSPGILNEI